MRKLWLSSALLFVLFCMPTPVSAAPSITNITTNATDYPNQEVPTYEKFEITFDLDNIQASNLQMPYDPSPPAGLDPEIGISVDAQFTPDNWTTTYTVPAFYHVDYDKQIISSKEWYYPNGNNHWKVRFAPPTANTWQFRLLAQDKGGSTQSNPQTFTAVSSENHGFIRVSSRDPRYFEFEDGTYFPGLGYNLNYRGVDWVNPILNNIDTFQAMKDNGIQLARIWLSQWGIYGSAWNPWRDYIHDGDPPAATTSLYHTHPDSDTSLGVSATWNRCMFAGEWNDAPTAVKPNTNYKIEVEYNTEQMDPASVIDPTQPYGFTIKFGGWMWGTPGQECFNAGTGTVIIPHDNANDPTWRTSTATWNSGSKNFLPWLHLVIDNLNQGVARINYVSVREDFGDGTYGPEILQRPSMDFMYHYQQQNSFGFDQVLDLANQHQVYLRPVMLEKNDEITKKINFDGSLVTEGSSGSTDNFYGDWSNPTKVRWLQQSWWRYAQARWGYSTNIHSWELLNEGDPFNGRHAGLANEFGKFMHGFSPNHHLVSTSNWTDFPRSTMWNSTTNPDIDFTDIHFYTSLSGGNNISTRIDNDYFRLIDTTINPNDIYHPYRLTNFLSQEIGALQARGTNKPVIRGEVALTNRDLRLIETNGLWLHNFVWAHINSGGLIESYWTNSPGDGHIYGNGNDYRHHFKTYFNFIKNVPLNNGHYTDIEATFTEPLLEVFGQKDTVNQRAHLWIKHANYTYYHLNPDANTPDAQPINPLSDTVSFAGFSPSQTYPIEWWDPLTGTITQTDSITSDSIGDIHLPITNLTADVAIRIGDYTSTDPPPQLTDQNSDGFTDYLDYLTFIPRFIAGLLTGDIDGNGLTNIFDLNQLLQTM